MALENWNEMSEGIYRGGSLGYGCPLVEAIVNLEDKGETKMLFPYTLKSMLWMPIKDAPPFPGLPWLEQCVDYIHSCREQGHRVLIHCRAGISRSAMVDLAYHMKYHNKSLEQAAEEASKIRFTSPHPAFMEGLEQWERHLTNQSSPISGK